jgi:hypothetical protein
LDGRDVAIKALRLHEDQLPEVKKVSRQCCTYILPMK